jgi:hypothetical protein
VSKQLRLVDQPDQPGPPRRRVSRGRRSAGATRRAIRVADWRLDDRARRVGLEGVARARAALEAGLREAS